MTVSEISGTMKYKDENGNVYIMFPVTTKDNINGIEDIEAEIVALKNKLERTPKSVVIKSSTEGSTKEFEITIDDSGSLSIRELT